MLGSRIVVLASSIATAIAASLCCIAPVAAALLGLTSFASAMALEPWRPYLLGVTAILLATAFALYFRDARRSWLILLIATLSVAGLAAFPYLSGQILPAVSTVPQTQKSLTVTTVFLIEGMTCEACASGLQASLRRVPGVAKAVVDYNGKKATISFDPVRQNRNSLAKVISSSGYSLKN